MQNPADLQNVGFGDPVDEEITRIANPVARPACFLAAPREMIGSTTVGDFRPLNAAGDLRIGSNFFDRGLNEPCVTLQSSRAEVLLGPGQDARDVAAGLWSDNDVHSYRRPS